MKKTVFFLLLLFCLSSCGNLTKIVEIPVEVTKTEYIVKEYHDTTIINNFTDKWRSNDTVYIKENNSVYRYINRYDTVIKIDSFPIYVKETLTKEVKKVPMFYQVMTWIGAIFCVILIIGIILKIKK